MEATGTSEGGRGVRLKMVATIMVPIFGTVGKPEYSGEIEEVGLVPDPEGGVRLVTAVNNTGTGRLGAKGHFEIINSAGEVVEKGDIGNAYVLRGAAREFSRRIEADLPAGRYKIRVRYKAVHLSKPLVRELTVDWKPPPKPEPPATQPGATTRPATSTQPATAPATSESDE